MSVILWKILIVSIILAETMIGAYLGWRMLKLIKRVKQVQEDKFSVIEQWNEQKMHWIILSDLEKKMILAALNMLEYGKAIQEPNTNFQARKTYWDLKKKIKDSIED